MNYLGIDYGEKRIGLAKAEDELKIATPLRTISNGENVLEEIDEIVLEEEIGEIVLGVPISLDGHQNKFALAIKSFGEKLEKEIDIKVSLQNEVLTTIQAARNDPKDIDASSAALILQGFLDRTNRSGIDPVPESL